MPDETPKEDSPLSPEQIESWKAMKVEIRMSVGESEFWLVPEYTDDEKRVELTPEDFLKHKMILDAFPGSKVKEFRKIGKDGKVEPSKISNGDNGKAKPRAARPAGQPDEHPF